MPIWHVIEQNKLNKGYKMKKSTVTFTVYFTNKHEVKKVLTEKNISFKYEESGFIGWLYVDKSDKSKVAKLIKTKKWQEGLSKEFIYNGV